jgi:isoleucyl-tRNA synthetase
VRTRQPLARALVTVPAARRARVSGLLDIVAAELNVKAVSFADGTGDLVDYRLAPAFRALGPRFGKDVGKVAGAVKAAGSEHGRTLLAGGRVTLEVPGLGPVELGPEEVEVHEVPVTGWRVASDGPATVALDLELTPELRREGLARELVRAVQDLRKASGLAVEDRIELAVKAAADGEVQAALEAHGEWIAGETLATGLFTAPQGDGYDTEAEIEGEQIRLWLRPVAR